VPTFRVHHSHESDECGAAFAAWRGFASPLRHRAATSSCRFGAHDVWWDVEAEGEEAALAQLPRFVAERSRVTRVADVTIP
jgi:hypothetical protein